MLPALLSSATLSLKVLAFRRRKNDTLLLWDQVDGCWCIISCHAFSAIITMLQGIERRMERVKGSSRFVHSVDNLSKIACKVDICLALEL